MKNNVLRHCFRLLALLAIGALWQGCAQDDDLHTATTGTAGEGELMARLEVLLPADQRGGSQTRMSAAEETAVSTVDVFHFVKNSDGKYYSVRNTPVRGTFTSGNPSYVNATLVTYPGQDSRLVMVVNARKSGDYGYVRNMEMSAFLSGLVFESLGEWNSTTGSATPLPMYAVTGDVDIKADIPGGIITDANSKPYALIRMHAKINVRLKSGITNFKLRNVCVFNRKTQGYIAYDESKWNKANQSAQFATAPHVPSTTSNVYEPTAPYFSAGMVPSDADFGMIINKQYLFEADNASQSDRLDKTAIVVGGLYNTTDENEITYYRIDIDATGGNILRNHLYDVEIQSVSDVGEDTPKEAFEGVNKMTAKVTAWNQADQNIILDGNYFLTVDKDNVSLHKEYTEVVFDLETNYNRSDLGFAAGILIDPTAITYSDGSGWITLEDVAGSNGSLVRKLKVKVATNTGAARSAKIYVKAGNMTKVLNISQDSVSGMSLRITDMAGNDITWMLFQNTMFYDQAEPQQFKVEWAGADDCMVTQTLTILGSLPFEFDPSSDLPAGSTGEVTTGVAYSGGNKSFTIQPARTPSTLNSTQVNSLLYRVTISFSISDLSGANTITKSLAVQHITKFERVTTHLPYVGAFWKWDQWGERIIRMSIPSGAWDATVISGADFIRLDTECSTDPNLWKNGVMPDDMNTRDAFHRLGSSASTSIGGTVIGNTAGTTSKGEIPNLYFRIGLTGPHPSLDDADANGSAKPRYGIVKVTHAEGSQLIYIRQGEAAAEVVPGSGVKWAAYNLSDPARNPGGENVTDHKAVSTNDTQFNYKKFADYPSCAGYAFRWNHSTAFHPSNPWDAIAITGWDNTTGYGAWVNSRETCPAGYRHPTAAVTTGEFTVGLVPGGDNDFSNVALGIYADGYFDRMYQETRNSGSGVYSLVGKTTLANIAYNGALFYDSATAASVFLPLPMNRSNFAGKLNTAFGSVSNYWGSTLYLAGAINYANYLTIDGKTKLTPATPSANTNFPRPVRCVRK